MPNIFFLDCRNTSCAGGAFHMFMKTKFLFWRPPSLRGMFFASTWSSGCTHVMSGACVLKDRTKELHDLISPLGNLSLPPMQESTGESLLAHN